MMGHMFGYGLGGSWLWMIGIALFRLLIIVGVIVLIVKLVKSNGNDRHTNYNRGNHGNNKAIDILKERYAKGEIDEEEYRRKLNMLKE